MSPRAAEPAVSLPETLASGAARRSTAFTSPAAECFSRALDQFHRLVHRRVRRHALEKAQLIKPDPQRNPHFRIEPLSGAVEIAS